MRNLVFIGDGTNRCSRQHRADSSALVEYQTHHPGEKLSGTGTPNHKSTGPYSKFFGAARACPDTDETAKCPEVHQKNEREAFGANGGYKKTLNNVYLARDNASQADSNKKCANHFAGPEGQDYCYKRRHNGPPAKVTVLQRDHFIKSGVNTRKNQS